MYVFWDDTSEQNLKGPSFEEHENASVFLFPVTGGGKNPFVIAEIDYDSFQTLKQYPYIQAVPYPLQDLLISSISYPPAIAFARRDIAGLKLDETITKKAFSDIVKSLLYKYLEGQPTDHFLLTEFLSSNIISGAFAGSFVWVVGYTPKIKVVHYVGHDYFIYADHVSSFKLTKQRIKQLPVHEMKKYVLVDNVNNNKQAVFDLTDETLDFDEVSELIRIVGLNNSKLYTKQKPDELLE